MMNLLKFELLKIRSNSFYGIVLTVFVSILLMFSALFYGNHNDFLDLQHQEANIMMQNISRSVLVDEPEVKEEYRLYSKLANTTTWQEAYGVLNEIDLLFIDVANLVEKNNHDLPYDSITNIEFRNYQMEHDIPPNDVTSTTFMVEGMTLVWNYLIPILIFVISAYVFVMEYEDKTIPYLFTLGYSHANILFSKWLSACIVTISSLCIPMGILYGILTLMYGSSHPQLLVEVSDQFALMKFHTTSFTGIYHAFSTMLVCFGVNILFISSCACMLTIVCKKYIWIFVIMGSCFACGIYVHLLFPIHKVLTSSIDIRLQCMVGVGVTIIVLLSSVQHLKHKSIL